MLSVNDITCSFGARTLFENVGFTLNPGDRAGLVGPNGAGKTTLLRIIAGQVEPDSGGISKPAQAVIGYLPQELTADEFTGTVWHEAYRAFEHIQKKADELDHVHEELSGINGDEKRLQALLERQHELSSFLEQAGYHQQEARTGRVLSGLGFREEDFHRPLSEFSGGWKMRACLARLLLSSPDVLLLDEPTNHLDIDSVTWLEEWLMNQKGALLLVSHDELFLNRLSMRIISLENSTAVTYTGNYHDYLEQSQERRRHLEAREKTRQARIRETERFIERFRAKATKAKQVQSRIKMLEREKHESVPDEHSRSVRFRFPEPERSGRHVITACGLSKGYVRKQTDGGEGAERFEVFHDLDFMVERGDHIAVVGPNGSGKSTLAKIIAGLLEPDSGSVETGHNVSVSYFGQHQAAELPQEATVLETMGQVPGGEVVQRVRDLLGAFLFHGDMISSRVKFLSGGEKSRLALARMLLNPANLLVMDEPTNHLDIASKKVLKDALGSFSGSFIIVSHDRAFLQGIISRVWEMRGSRLTDHIGGIDDYMDAVAARKALEASDESPEASGMHGGGGQGQGGRRVSARELRRQAAREREFLRQKLGPLQKKVQEAEAAVQNLEEEKEKLEALLADPAIHSDGSRMKELNLEYRNVTQQIDEMYVLWELAEEKFTAAQEILKSS